MSHPDAEGVILFPSVCFAGVEQYCDLQTMYI